MLKIATFLEVIRMLRLQNKQQPEIGGNTSTFKEKNGHEYWFTFSRTQGENSITTQEDKKKYNSSF